MFVELAIADAANALMDEMGWVVSSPNTMAEWSIIYEAMEKARKDSILYEYFI